jgi:hypothetical protein
MNDSHLALLCTVQEIGARYPGLDDDQRLFELVVVPAIVGWGQVAGDPASWIRTASWYGATKAPISKLLVAWTYEGGVPAPAPQLVDVLPVPFDKEPNSAAARSLVDVQFNAPIPAVLEGLDWSPEPDLDYRPDALRGRLVRMLSSVSTWAAPLPQRLHLSFAFRLKIPKGQRLETVAAAPIFKAWPDADTPEWVLDAVPVADPSATHATWKYKVSPQPAIAYCGGYVLGDTPPEACIDLRTMWIRPPLEGRRRRYVEDWSTQLRSHVGRQFDLVQRMVDALRMFVRKPDKSMLGPLEASVSGRLGVAFFRDAVVAALRDLCASGVGSAVSGGSRSSSLAFEALRRTRGPGGSVAVELGKDESAAISKLQDFDQAMDLAVWRALVARLVPELAGTFALSSPETFPAQRTWDDELADLERVQAAMREPSKVRALVFEQWRLALEKTPLWEQRRTKLREFFERTDVLLESGRSLVEPWWSRIVALEDSPDREPARLASNIADALALYFQDRFDPAPAKHRPAAALPLGDPWRTSFAKAMRDALEREVARWIEERALGESGVDQVVARSDEYLILSLGAAALRGERVAIGDDRVQREVVEVVDGSQPARIRVKPALPFEIRLPERIRKLEQPASVPQGVAFQVDRLSGDPAELGGADAERADRLDYLRRISGVVGIVRPSGVAGGWRYLNMARLDTGKGTALLHERALVPSRLNYRDGLRQAFLTYDNQPLVAASPLSDTTADYLRSGHEHVAEQLSDSQHAANARWIPLRYDALDASLAADTWSKLPMLKFGESYDFAAFVVSNGGAIPREIAAASDDNTKPNAWQPRDPATLSEAEFSSYVHTVRYLRRVPVGAVRLARRPQDSQLQVAAAVEESALPAIPTNVFPLARELGWTKPSEPGGAELPLLLLAAKADPDDARSISFDRAQPSWTLRLRRPATDLETWERWIAVDPGASKQRIQVRAGVIRALHANSLSERASEEPSPIDVSIDDPACSEALEVEWIRLAGGPAASWSRTVVCAGAAGDGLPSVQSGAAEVAVRCETSAPAGLFDGGEAGKALARLAPGDVFELRVHALVPVDHFDGKKPRFSESLAPRREEAVEIPSLGRFYRRGSLRVVVEAASAAMPDAETLWNRLRPRVVRDAVEVVLAKPRLDVPDVARFLHRIDLQRQLWRWDGRPSSWASDNPQSFPFAESERDPTGAAPTATMRWEAWSFGERDALDVSRHAHDLDAAIEGEELLLRESLENTTRARFYRFRATATSRYTGLSRTSFAVETMFERELDHSRMTTPWRRLFVPCRRSERPTRPHVRIVVPLTESELGSHSLASSSAHGPNLGGLAPLMVVLDEPWFEEGGLAEELEVELMQEVVSRELMQEVVSRDNKPPVRLSQYGSDPTLVAAAADPGESVPKELELVGPIGVTFDTDTAAPRLGASMFLVRARFDGPPSRPPRWPFAKLRFRRRLKREEGDSSSDWTEAHWIQFLPDARELATWNLGEGTLLSWNPGAEHELRIADTAPEPPMPPGFSRFFLVTLVVCDASGRAGEEVYVGVFASDAQRTILRAVDSSRGLAADARPTGEVRVRILEVQWREGEAPPESDLLAALFAIDETSRRERTAHDDARGRIVRVSTYVTARIGT